MVCSGTPRGCLCWHNQKAPSRGATTLIHLTGNQLITRYVRKVRRRMQQTKKLAAQPVSTSSAGRSRVIQALLSVGAAALTLFILWQGFLFLRDSTAPKWIIAIVAIVW